jgi:twitching motility protein PilJ
MSALEDNKSKISTGSNMGLLMSLLAIFLIAGAVNLFVGYVNGQHNQTRITKSGDLRVLSQQIAKNASEASQGNKDAFAQLKQSTTEFQTKFKMLNRKSADLPPSSKAIRDSELKSVENLWNDIKESSSEILNRESTVLGLHEISEKLNFTIPRMQSLYLNVQDDLLDTRSTPEQMMFTARQLLFAERIIRSLQKVLTGGDDAKIASENFGADVETFGQVLTGMLDGDELLGVSRIRSASTRKHLTDISDLYVEVKENVDKVISATDPLFAVHEASDNIFEQAKAMLTLTENLQLAYDRESNNWKQFGHPVWSAAAGLVIILLLMMMYFRQRRDQRARTKIARLTADEEKAQNERNQQAIIRLLDEMEGLADGDLTTNATVTEDFTGAIADAMNFTIDQLRNLVATIKESVVKLANATDATQNISRELAQASRNQAQEITGASAAINEMAVSIEQVSANASESATVAEKSVDIAKKGGEVVRNTIQGMDTIREQIQETSKRIKRLGESSQEIGDIVSLINDISDQTNILALNAAIQASMAGDAGRGFAVVADEVQRLAERSGNATKQIEALVKTIQTDTNEAVISMEASTSEVVHGARLAQDAGVALEEIERVSKSLADLIQNISNAARQQAASAGHVSNTMNVIQEITNQTSEGSQNTATSIGTLAELADELNNSIAGFKLPDEV